MSAIKIGIVGLGKIARDQHLPSLAADANFELAAVASRSAVAPLGVPVFRELGEMLGAMPGLDAVSFCTPPHGRHALALLALNSGLHVMLEKPPGMTVAEVEGLAATARERGVALFASWHSRASAAVEAARLWLRERTLHRVEIRWRENVREWHPGQQWIWTAGGLGVFDPGINALSIVTHILPRPVFVTGALLSFPANRETPIAAELTMSDSQNTPVTADFDFRQVAHQTWEITVDTDAGRLDLAEGGAIMRVNGAAVALAPNAEYPALYRQFSALIRDRRSDVDLMPLRLVADAFLLARRQVVEAFDD